MRHLAETHDSLFHISPFHILLTLLFHISLFLEASLSRKRDGMYTLNMRHLAATCLLHYSLQPVPPQHLLPYKEFWPKILLKCCFPDKCFATKIMILVRLERSRLDIYELVQMKKIWPAVSKVESWYGTFKVGWYLTSLSKWTRGPLLWPFDPKLKTSWAVGTGQNSMARWCLPPS